MIAVAARNQGQCIGMSRMAKSPRKPKPRQTPYARFGKIHEVCPDLVNFFHYVENLKPGLREGIHISDLRAGLIVLAGNCRTLIEKLGSNFKISSEWTESNVAGHWDQVAAHLAEAEHTPWHHAQPGQVRPGTTQTSELLELAEYVFEVGIAKGDEITLVETAERINAMIGTINVCGVVPNETLADLDERQEAPEFKFEQG